MTSPDQERIKKLLETISAIHAHVQGWVDGEIKDPLRRTRETLGEAGFPIEDPPPAEEMAERDGEPLSREEIVGPSSMEATHRLPAARSPAILRQG